MEVTATAEGLELHHDGALVAEAAPTSAALQAVAPVGFDAAQAASRHYPGHTFHPFPTCFSCGVDRTDGLRIFPGPVDPDPDGRTRVAAPWVPSSTVPADWHEYVEPEPHACLASTWAALDCIGGWAGDLGERLMVLARMTAVVEELAVVGEPHVVTGAWRAGEGRRTMTASTLYAADGRAIARAEHVWVAVDPARFGGRPGQSSESL
jgi:hypothetical protein